MSFIKKEREPFEVAVTQPGQSSNIQANTYKPNNEVLLRSMTVDNSITRTNGHSLNMIFVVILEFMNGDQVNCNT